MTSESVNNNSTEHICDEDNDNKWRLIPGADSASTGEAKFECVVCGNQRFRDGYDSANWLDVGIPLTHAEIKLAKRYAAKEQGIRTEKVDLKLTKAWISKNAFLKPDGKYGISRPKNINLLTTIKAEQTNFDFYETRLLLSEIEKEVTKCSVLIDCFLDYLILKLLKFKLKLKKLRKQKKK